MARSTASTARTTMHSAGRLGRDVSNNPGSVFLVRFGYAAKGVVYLIIGALAARVALGSGGATPDRNTAIEAIYTEPFGRFLLGIVAVGLAAYALWSFVRAAFDPEREGTDARGVATRIGYAAVGVSYALLAAGAFRLLLGSGSAGKSSDASTQDVTAQLLQKPFGQALVAIVGLIVLVVACFLFRRAYTAKFQKRLALTGLGARGRQWIVGLGRLGHTALGVVFAEIGVFLIVAAGRHNPRQAKGIGGALSQLAREPYGHALLAIVALGLACYGIFSLVQARYRHVGGA